MVGDSHQLGYGVFLLAIFKPTLQSRGGSSFFLYCSYICNVELSESFLFLFLNIRYLMVQLRH